MSNYFKDAKEYESKQRHRQKWVNVFDAWQLPLGGSALGASRIQGDADSDVLGTWIKVSSLADMVKQIRDGEDAQSIGLRLHGATKARVSGSDKRERAYYIAVGAA